MQLANIVRERWKGVLFCLIVAIPATLLGKQVEVVGGDVQAQTVKIMQEICAFLNAEGGQTILLIICWTIG